MKPNITIASPISKYMSEFSVGDTFLFNDELGMITTDQTQKDKFLVEWVNLNTGKICYSSLYASAYVVEIAIAVNVCTESVESILGT